MTKKYTGAGYIIRNFPVPKNVYDFIRSLTSTYPQPYHRFISHIFASMVIERNKKRSDPVDEIMIPIYSRLMEKEFNRDIKYNDLKKLKCLSIIPQDQLSKKSRKYNLSEEIFEEALRIDSEYILNAWNSMLQTGICSFRMVNLMTGNRIVSKKKHQKTVLSGNNGYNTNISPLIKNSMDCFEPCPFNPEKIYQLVLAQKRVFEDAKYEFEKIKNTCTEKKPRNKRAKRRYKRAKKRYKRAKERYKRAQGVFLNDYNSLRTILLQQPERIASNPAVYKYQAAYKTQISGRLTENTGGFQGASQPFKELFFTNSQKVFNYDLKSSQAYLLLAELEKNDIHCQWLIDYLDGKKDKDYYARKIGIDVATWKDCFYALVMGADVENKNFGSIYESIYSTFKNTKKAQIPWERFILETKDLSSAVKKWRNFIYTTQDRDYTYQHNFKYWKNACDMRHNDHWIDSNGNLFSVSDPGNPITNKPKIKSVKRRLAAFILQGQEACFIHNLTLLCKKTGIPVYKNEHDGLITGGKIPQKLVVVAAKKANIKIPTLSEKPICSDAKRNKMKKHLGKKLSSPLFKI